MNGKVRVLPPDTQGLPEAVPLIPMGRDLDYDYAPAEQWDVITE